MKNVSSSPEVGGFQTTDVLDEAPRQRIADVLVELPSSLKDRPPDAFVAFAENALQLPSHVLAVRDPAAGTLADHLFYRFQ
jgi:hypothetical protein